MRRLRQHESERLLDRALEEWQASQVEEPKTSPDRLPLSNASSMRQVLAGLYTRAEDKTFWRIENGELVRDETLTNEAQVEELLTEKRDE